MSENYSQKGAGARPRRKGNKVKAGACLLGEYKPREKVDFDALRRAEIDMIIQRRHGGTIPETDDADLYVREMARAVAASFPDPDDRQSFMVDWLRKRAPWMADIDREADRYLPLPGCPVAHRKAQPAGEHLCLTFAERTAFGIRTIKAYDKTSAEVKEIRRQENRDRKRQARLKAGCTPRTESLSQTRPWDAEGCSRRTWERRRKKQFVANSADHDPGAEMMRDANSAHYPNGRDANSSAVILGYIDSLCSKGEMVPDAIASRSSPSIAPTIMEMQSGVRRRGPSRAPTKRSRQLDLFERRDHESA